MLKRREVHDTDDTVEIEKLQYLGHNIIMRKLYLILQGKILLQPDRGY